MDSKTTPVLSEPVDIRNHRRALHETVRLHLGFFVLGLICLAVSLLAFPMLIILPRPLRRRLGRRLIAASARAYLRFLELMGACRFDLSGLDALQGAPAMVIAPNHPSLLDAIMILSRLPGAGCIMKADIVNSVFFGASARLTGYIRSTPLRTMVQLAVDDLHQGNHLLLLNIGEQLAMFHLTDMEKQKFITASYASNAPIEWRIGQSGRAYLVTHGLLT